MNLEIERKFLVTETEQFFSFCKSDEIQQAYIFQTEDIAFRIGIKNDTKAKICL